MLFMNGPLQYLDLESSLESAGKESSERSDDGCKDGHEEGVQQERIQRHCLLHPQLKQDEEKI